MISVDQYEFIRTVVRVHGKPIREVSRVFKYSRKTIRKALADDARVSNGEAQGDAGGPSEGILGAKKITETIRKLAYSHSACLHAIGL